MPPPKRVEQTNAIFEQLSRVNPQADQAPGTLRLSLDAKATVNVGPFSRKGRSRTKTKAADHDFKPESTLTPFGIFSPEHDDLTLYLARSKVTSDFIVDRLRTGGSSTRSASPRSPGWCSTWTTGRRATAAAPSSSSGWSDSPVSRLDIDLAYYPPYHSKYNPIERCFGILELHWNGSLLDSVEAVLGYPYRATFVAADRRVIGDPITVVGSG